MSNTHYYFIPSVRRGLAAAIKKGARGGARRAQIDVLLRVTARRKGAQGEDSDNIAQALQLYGPGDILGFHDRIVARHHPEHDVGDFEPNYFPSIEFADVDFAWRFTADKARDQTGQLTPWVTLVVLVSEPQGDIQAEFATGPEVDKNLPPNILVSRPALPELKQAWRWAHVHITEGSGKKNELESVLRDQPEDAVCRLLCARRLAPKTRYAAFVVPTFKLGVLAGLGYDLDPDVSALDPAWLGDSSDERLPYYLADGDRLTLPYYYRWEFSTGLRGDFEHLVRLLERRSLSGLGVRDIDCQHPGFGVRGVNPAGPGAPESHYLGMEGALQSLDTQYTEWGRDSARGHAREPEPLQVDLSELVNNPEAQRIVVHFTPEILDASFVIVEPDGNTSVKFTWHTSRPCKGICQN